MRIAMVGSGYVGLVSGACLAEIGHEVSCIDQNEEKIKLLSDGISPIYEPGIEKLIRQNHLHERLHFSTNIEEAITSNDVIFIAVGTPTKKDGGADLQFVKKVAHAIGTFAERDIFVIVKSTVPVGTCDIVEEIIERKLKDRLKRVKVEVASNPEFLKEGSAISDFMKPDRIVIGLKHGVNDSVIREIYRPFIRLDPSKLIIVERKASELIKYTSNAMLATRISFMNELAQLCEKVDVDIEQVRIGVGADKRIGKDFLFAGPGYGGSCLPKDVSALLCTSEEQGIELNLLQATRFANEKQKDFVAKKIKEYFKDLTEKRIAIWGLSFKPGTDDVREAPSLTVIPRLLEWGAEIVAHDPQAQETFHDAVGPSKNLTFVSRSYEAIKNAHALVLLTEWGEYKWPNWKKMWQMMDERVVFDFRNQYDPTALVHTGFIYHSIGRPSASS